jgi:2-aminoethylphosphonate-pyruvate transaminase
VILLTPGPCMTSESVRQAGAMPDMNHRDPEYTALVAEVRERLLGLYETPDWSAYLIGGSGTAAVEAMITSIVGDGGCLILENGYYSERIGEIFEACGIRHKRLRFGWLEAWDFDRIEDELKSGRYEAVLGTHHETTAGRLNDISRLGRLCREHGAKCLIDAMSSFGVESIDFSVLDAVCSSANKCLHGIPGVSFVLCSPDTVRAMARTPRRNYYLNLPLYRGPEPPLTPPVPAMAAFRQALREMGSVAKRRAEYLELWHMVRDGMAALGHRPVVPAGECSITLSAMELPEGLSASDWIAYHRDRGYLLYGCKGELRDRCYQASNMGHLGREQVEGWLALARQAAADPALFP